jgi:4a-hydroxytetrahydrobiopterin dehydratase
MEVFKNKKIIIKNTIAMEWKNLNNRLVRTFSFDNFQQALAFVNLVGVVAENQKHHPDIKMYDYCFVEISTTTHEADYTITDKDKELVKAIDAIIGA